MTASPIGPWLRHQLARSAGPLALVVLPLISCDAAAAQDHDHVTDRPRYTHGAVSTQRMAARIRATALEYWRNRWGSSRTGFYDIAFPKDAVEYEQLAGHGLMLVTTAVQDSTEIPPARAYVRTQEGDVTLRPLFGMSSKFASQDTIVTETLGQYRNDTVYLFPVYLKFTEGTLLVDFAANRTEFSLDRFPGRIPSWLQSIPREPPTGSAPPERILDVVQREYPGLVESFLGVSAEGGMSYAEQEIEESMPTDILISTRFTRYPTRGVTPDWSPDGKWIAVTSNKSGNEDIWIKSVVSDEEVQITHDPSSDRVPRWSPDGTMLLFASDRTGTLNLWTVSPFETERTATQVTSDADVLAAEGTGSWSPDGTEIVFASDRDGNYDLWIISASDGARRQLTSHPQDEWAADWSPDGQWIAFNAGDRKREADLWIIPSNGGAARQLTAQQSYAPSWSPDGEWIVFCSMRGPDRGLRYSWGGWDIWLFPSSGGTPLRLTKEPGQDELEARWSPDGTKIVYNRKSLQSGDHGLWIAHVSNMKSTAEKMIHQRITGQVTKISQSALWRRLLRLAPAELPWEHVAVRVHDERGALRHTATTSDEGRYQVWAAPGSYVVSVAGVEGADPVEVTLQSDQTEEVDFTGKQAETPEELLRAAGAYRELKGYRDSTTVTISREIRGRQMTRTASTQFAFQRPNKLRLDTRVRSSEMAIVSDGMTLTRYYGALDEDGLRHYSQEDAPEKATLANFSGPTSDHPEAFLFHILTSDDPVKALTDDVEAARKVGYEKLEDGSPVTVIELKLTVRSLAERWVPFDGDMEELVDVRLWIDRNDHLIRKVAYELEGSYQVEDKPGARPWTMMWKLAFTEHHTATRVAPTLPEDTFIFAPPEGAKLIDAWQ